jgi:hypothetical protein
MMSWLRTCSPPSLILIAGWCLIGATHRRQPWTSALMLRHMRYGLSALLMEVLCMFCRPSLCRQVHRELMRNALPDLTPNNTRICLPPKKLSRGIQ